MVTTSLALQAHKLVKDVKAVGRLSEARENISYIKTTQVLRERQQLFAVLFTKFHNLPAVSRHAGLGLPRAVLVGSLPADKYQRLSKMRFIFFKNDEDALS